jgi:hypothetical protein
VEEFIEVTSLLTMKVNFLSVQFPRGICFNETSYAPEVIFIAFFEGFNFSASLNTVGYF